MNCAVCPGRPLLREHPRGAHCLPRPPGTAPLCAHDSRALSLFSFPLSVMKSFSSSLISPAVENLCCLYFLDHVCKFSSIAAPTARAEICFKVLAVSSCGFPCGSLVPEYISLGLCYPQLSLCAETLVTAPRFILFSPHLHGLTGYIYFLPLGLFIYLVSRVRECQVGARQ